jgi:hypothetical protein
VVVLREKRKTADDSGMDYQGTPLNMTTLIVVAIALIGIFMLLRKRYDSNLPLLFYFIALVFTNATDRTVNPILLYTGLGLALLLRFEFMNRGFSKVVAFLATGSMGLIVFVFLAEVFGDGNPPF